MSPYSQQDLSSDTDWVDVDDHYNPADLDLLLDQHGCTHTRIFQEFFWSPVCSRRETVFVPTWLNAFCNFDCGHPILTDNVATVDCFNFMVYKQRPLRRLVLTELLNRKLTTNSYIYCESSGIGFGAPGVLNMIEPKYFGVPKEVPTMPDNISNYNNFLREHVFERSAVALITETIEPEWNNNMTFSEKTLWAMLSLNFPIWLGGRLQAELWQNAGFDTFNDVIDQTYQYESDPMLRIQLALDNNIKLLTDLQYVTALRNKMLDRLKRNRELVLNGAIGRYTDQLLSSLDENCLAFFKR